MAKNENRCFPNGIAPTDSFGHCCEVLFETLELLFESDAPAFGAAMNMAVDEVLLTRAQHPILRVYAWARPAVTFGYFESWTAVAAQYPPAQWELIRRWTGGGVVPHDADWTYSVIVPRTDPFARLSAGESYRILHEQLAEAMTLGGLGTDAVALTPAAVEKVSHACFENPAQHDLLAAGRKIAGAAQRRSRFGLLHQGSVQNLAVPPGFASALGANLARTVQPRVLSRSEETDAQALAAAKYATEAWNRRY